MPTNVLTEVKNMSQTEMQRMITEAKTNKKLQNQLLQQQVSAVVTVGQNNGFNINAKDVRAHGKANGRIFRITNVRANASALIAAPPTTLVAN